MMTREVREKISKSQTGRKLSIETRKKMSKNRKGKIAINNGIHNKYINKNDLALYLKEGYIKGGLSRKKGDKGVKIR